MSVRNGEKRTSGVVMTPEQTVRALDVLVGELEARYTEMLSAVEAHEAAMRMADINAMASCVAKENEAVQAIAKLDAKRAEIFALHEKAGGVKREGATITSIARSIGGEAGGRLAKRASELRDLVKSVRTKATALEQAASMLSAHTDGIMRQVMQMLNHAQVYSRGGSVGAGPKVTSSLDVTS